MPEQHWTEELVKAARDLDKARAAKPRRPRDCKRHEYLESDHCHWCGTPMPQLPAEGTRA